MYGALDLGNHAGRIAERAHLQCLQAPQRRVLGEGQVEIIQKRSTCTAIPGILGNSYNLDRFFSGTNPSEVMTDSILIGPVFLRHCLIHDCYLWRVVVVRVLERPPLDHRNFHRSEVVTGDELKLRSGAGLARWGLVAIDDERVAVVVVTHGGTAGCCGCLNTTELSDAGEQVAVEL